MPRLSRKRVEELLESVPSSTPVGHLRGLLQLALSDLRDFHRLLDGDVAPGPVRVQTEALALMITRDLQSVRAETVADLLALDLLRERVETARLRRRLPGAGS